MTALDQLMDEAATFGARVEWGRRGLLHTVVVKCDTSFGSRSEVGIAEDRERAAAVLLSAVFGVAR